jgi:hypothetical protein
VPKGPHLYDIPKAENVTSERLDCPKST